MKALTLAISAAALLAASPVAAQEKSWTGIYAGLNAQYTWNNWDWPGAPGYVAPPVPAGVDSGAPNQDLSGAMFGGVLGYNYQIDRIVLGVEGDFNFGNLSDSKRDGNYIVETSKIENFASIRARAGLLVSPALLVYATGGVAFENMTYGESCPDKAAVPFGWCSKHGAYDLSKSQWNTGYVVGGGAEWMIAENVSLKLEGLYADFGTNTYDLGKMGDGIDLPSKKISSSETSLRIGLNYHF